MKLTFTYIHLIIILAIVATVLIGDSSFAFAQDDPFSALEEEGNKFVDFLLNKVARIVAAIVAFGYIVRFMITKRFDLQEFLIFGTCIISLGSIGFIIDYFFQ